MITVVAQFEVKPAELDQFLQHCDELIAETRKENGCLSYHLYQNTQQLLGVLIEVVRQAAVFLTGFGNQLIAMLQELIQLGRFDFELGNYGNHHDSLVLVDRRLAAFD